MDNKSRELRLYGLVPYNLSPIQQGIQFGHAAIEYSLAYSGSTEYLEWAKNWKTFIILNGGTTNNKKVATFNNNGDVVKSEFAGSLNNHAKLLEENGVKIAKFEEPDLGDQLTAVVFIVDERVFNKKIYPDYEIFSEEESSNEHLPTLENWMRIFSDDPEESEKIIFLREFLKNFRLA